MADYFCEILTEEIPASMHEAALATLHERLTRVTADLRNEEGGNVVVSVTATSRRLVCLLTQLPLKENDREEEVKGPPRKAAFDADQQPTQALAGFLRKNGVSAGEIIDGGDYIRIRKSIAGRETAAILQASLPEVFESLRWPKMMRWGLGEYAWVRPVHSVISLFDGQLLPLTIFGVSSGRSTSGHRTLSPGKIEVQSYGEYVSKLELARVVIDTNRRRHVMAERARILAKEAGGVPSEDPSIWAQWQYLTEYPGVVRAEFRNEYLALPEEVLVMVMRVHQKQLPVRDVKGNLTSSFLAVMDNDGDLEGNAAYGNSFVTNARFADAQFFYETDRRTPLAERREQLTRLQFQEKLGNYLEKTKRIERIVNALAKDLGIDPANAVRAAQLSKTDLVTEMVKEFTELQGKVGGIYAREEGLPDDVWQAIYDHYLPVSIDDPLPRTVSGMLVSLADKIDTLSGFFTVGSRPTGSKDPFALRRAAQGIVQTLLARGNVTVTVGVDRLIDLGLDAHGLQDKAAVAQELLTFLGERVKTLLEGELAYDEITAAMEAGWSSSITDLRERARALHSVREQANFLSILDSARRIANITAGYETSAVDPAKLHEDAEKRLSMLADVVVEQIEESLAERNYVRALETFAGMAPELEAFFSDVMVMVDDLAVRNNRMALLRKVGGAVMKIADVTKIVVDRNEYRG